MEIKFKRVMSISAATVLNLTRDVMDDELTQEEFYKIMFILASYEEAGWTEENLKKKAKAFINDLSSYAQSQLDNAIDEGSQMYLRYWDLIDKQNRSRNGKGKGKTTGTAENTPTPTEPIQSKKETSMIAEDAEFWVEDDDVKMTPKAYEAIKKSKYNVDQIGGYILANEKTLVLPFDPYTMEEVIEMFDADFKKQYPAAPSRGK